MKGKKGMSPLIATILLMAFAVALGGMIMNWSSSLPTGGADCAELKLSIDAFCREGNQVKLGLRNIGTEDIAEVRLVIVDQTVKEEKTILGSALNKGQTLSVMVPFANSPDATFSILPARGTPAEPIVCPEPVHSVQGLPVCPS